jgi:hypothetical protein
MDMTNGADQANVAAATTTAAVSTIAAVVRSSLIDELVHWFLEVLLTSLFPLLSFSPKTKPLPSQAVLVVVTGCPLVVFKFESTNWSSRMMIHGYALVWDLVDGTIKKKMLYPSWTTT